jgi:DNA-binding MurR/RpiR family transcriptional regulator
LPRKRCAESAGRPTWPLLRSREARSPSVKAPTTSVPDTVEERIDDCLTAARNLDKDGLEEVIRLLRKARNAVVWKIGQ